MEVIIRSLLIVLIVSLGLAVLSGCTRSNDNPSSNDSSVLKSHIGEVTLQTDIDSKAYEWSFLSTPENKEKRLFNSDKKDAFFSANVAGKYEVRLRTDNDIINYTIETYDLPKFNVSSPQIYNNNSTLSYSAIINVEGSYSGELESILLMDIKNDLSYTCLMPTDNSFKCMDISLNTGDNAFMLQSVDILGKDVIQNLVITKYTDDLFLTLPSFSTNAVEVNETEEITAQIIVGNTGLELTINLVKELEDGTYDFVAEMKNIGNSKYSTTFSANNSKEKAETYRVVALANNDQEIRSLPVMLDYYVFDIENFENVAKSISSLMEKHSTEMKHSNVSAFTEATPVKNSLSNAAALSIANELRVLNIVEGVAVNDDYMYVEIKNSAPHIIIFNSSDSAPIPLDDNLNNIDESEQVFSNININKFTYLPNKSGIYKVNSTDENIIGSRTAIFLDSITGPFAGDLDNAYIIHNDSHFKSMLYSSSEVSVPLYTNIADYGVVMISAHGWDIVDLDYNERHLLQIETYEMRKLNAYYKTYKEGREYLYGISEYATNYPEKPNAPIQSIGITDDFINTYNTFNNTFVYLGSCNSSAMIINSAGATMSYVKSVTSMQARAQLEIISDDLVNGFTVLETYERARDVKFLELIDAELLLKGNYNLKYN